MRVWATIARALEAHGRCAMVSVVEVEGSAPREPGARLIVVPHGFHGTIGGGALEWRAIAAAQAMLDGGPAVALSTHALGPDLGQCCGGRVTLLTEVFGRESLEELQPLVVAEEKELFACESRIGSDRVARQMSLGSSSRRKPEPNSPRAVSQNTKDPSGAGMGPGFRRDDGHEAKRFTETFGETLRPLFLFGAGHVGRALVLALASLPFGITWIDPRPEAFPAAVPGNVTLVRAGDPVASLAAAPRASFVLVMTHSHALDLAITAAGLRDRRFAYVGLIGSASKRARFERRLRDAGLEPRRIAELICPIGIPGIASKAPAAIAASVAAQILMRDEALHNQTVPVAIPTKPAIVAAGGRG